MSLVIGQFSFVIWGVPYLPLRFHGIRRRALRTRRPEEDLLPVGESQISSVRSVSAIFRLIAIDQDFGSDGQVFLREASSQKRIWRTTFYHPARCRSICIFHIHVNPR